eukprot:CAMPEP_0204319292 /NCGR_PEP_ID=MMETSP0469-20131031/7016_1 /ASSEMBLY_ACC=CAM_ASM_000384 /TAXON_ID=2969 /ORGANISM="Oxyrrhis marina" /LENGTH=521 /DNA_ID=CAMNT_0051300457 /DNA_START=56 /DNA_END=1621 /DNA_ORIENTATION=-
MRVGVALVMGVLAGCPSSCTVTGVEACKQRECMECAICEAAALGAAPRFPSQRRQALSQRLLKSLSAKEPATLKAEHSHALRAVHKKHNRRAQETPAQQDPDQGTVEPPPAVDGVPIAVGDHHQSDETGAQGSGADPAIPGAGTQSQLQSLTTSHRYKHHRASRKTAQDPDQAGLQATLKPPPAVDGVPVAVGDDHTSDETGGQASGADPAIPGLAAKSQQSLAMTRHRNHRDPTQPEAAQDTPGDQQAQRDPDDETVSEQEVPPAVDGLPISVGDNKEADETAGNDGGQPDPAIPMPEADGQVTEQGEQQAQAQQQPMDQQPTQQQPMDQQPTQQQPMDQQPTQQQPTQQQPMDQQPTQQQPMDQQSTQQQPMDQQPTQQQATQQQPMDQQSTQQQPVHQQPAQQQPAQQQPMDQQPMHQQPVQQQPAQQQPMDQQPMQQQPVQQQPAQEQPMDQQPMHQQPTQQQPVQQQEAPAQPQVAAGNGNAQTVPNDTPVAEGDNSPTDETGANAEGSDPAIPRN